jgi:hypothetical protein
VDRYDHSSDLFFARPARSRELHAVLAGLHREGCDQQDLIACYTRPDHETARTFLAGNFYASGFGVRQEIERFARRVNAR